MTGSKDDSTINVWKVQNIEDDSRHVPTLTMTTKSSLNQICMIQNSQSIAVATEQGIEIYDFNGLQQKDHEKVNSIRIEKMDEEVLQILNAQMPISYTQQLVAATQKGSILLYDLIAR